LIILKIGSVQKKKSPWQKILCHVHVVVVVVVVGVVVGFAGLASNLPRPKDLVKMAESCMYSPVYRNFR
jgi:hypothetical protein